MVNEEKQKILDLGFSGYIAKPCTKNDFYKEIHQVLCSCISIRFFMSLSMLILGYHNN